ncbi:DnaB-like helicase C-terminal domain-containing protein, partial [Proteiniphilum sp.]
DSGTLCDDADVVLFIFRPEYYRITEDERGNSLLGVAEIMVKKNRNGSPFSVNLHFDPEYRLFSNIIQ